MPNVGPDYIRQADFQSASLRFAHASKGPIENRPAGCNPAPRHAQDHRKFHDFRSSETPLGACSWSVCRFMDKRRDESRRGTHECARHVARQKTYVRGLSGFGPTLADSADRLRLAECQARESIKRQFEKKDKRGLKRKKLV